MKLKIMSLVVATGVFFSCGTPSYTSTTTSTSDNAAYAVPAGVQTNFTTQYPNAANVTWSAYDAAVVPIDWEMTGWTALDAGDHAVVFDMDNERYYAWYDQDGNWIGSSYGIRDHTTLPSSINSMIQTKYSGYTIEKVDRELWKDQTAYEVKLKSGDRKVKLLVDANGNVLKEKVKD